VSDTADISAGAPKKRRRSKKRSPGAMVSEAALEELHATVCGVGLMVASLVPEDHRPLPDEVEAMLVPLERIYLRHMPETGVNPDVADVLIFSIAFAGYMNRVGGFRSLGSKLTRFSRSSRPAPRHSGPPPQPAATRGTGGYRTPEEKMAEAVITAQTTEEAAAAYQRAQERADYYPEPSGVAGTPGSTWG
jgi:hypothetical protein